MDEEIYHEKQHLLFCGVHAINNLFQNPCTCNKEKLDDVCYSLNPSRWLNPHKSKFGLGNYDVNAIIAFLMTLNYEVVWFDKRKSVNEIDVNHVFGFLLNNISKQSLFGKTFSLSPRLKHWYIVRKIKESYYNLDSKLQKPSEIGNEKKLQGFLSTHLAEDSCQLLLIVESGKSTEEVYNNSYDKS